MSDPTSAGDFTSPPSRSHSVEAQFREWEHRFRVRLESGFDLIVELDSETVIQFASPSIKRILGIRPEQALVRSLFEFLHPDDFPRVTELFTNRGEWVGQSAPIKMRVRHEDGSWRDLEGVASYAGTASPATAPLVLNCRDVTERRLAEDETRLHRAVLECQSEASLDGILVVSAEQRILHFNRRFVQMWGIPPAALSPRMDIVALDRAKQLLIDPEAFTAKVEELYGEPVKTSQDELRFRDGRIIERYSAPITCDAGRLRGRVWYFRDVTEKRRLESHLLHSQRLESLGTLASGIVHELRNVLAPILGNTSLASLDLPSGHPAQDYLKKVLEAGKRAKDLVQRILSFSRCDEQPRSPVELGPVVAEALKLLRSTLPSTVEVHAKIASLVPLVLANATEIHQVVMNLGINAWQAMAGGVGKLEVVLETVTFAANASGLPPGLAPGCYLRLSIGDDGKGMDVTTLHRIFEPFFTTRPSGEGTGLGLSVVHGIVKNHRGVITAQSAPGQGTVFDIYFPAHEAPPVSAPPAIEARICRRVLFVDDDAALIELTERSLRRHGYQMVGFTGPLDALNAFRAQPDAFDFIVSDLSLPKTSGWDLAREFRAIRSDVRIVLVTGSVRPQDELRSRSEGLADVLEKPHSIEDFADLLHRIFSQTPTGATEQ